MVPKSVFDAVQEVMKGKSRPKPESPKTYIYRGIFRCNECGGLFTNEIQKGFVYLRCTKKRGPCSQKYVRQESVGEQVTAYLRRFVLPSDWTDAMLSELAEERKHDAAARQDAGGSTRKPLTANDEKLERLMHAYLDKTLSLEEYRVAKQQLVEEKQELKDRLAILATSQETWLEPTIRFISDVKSTELLTAIGSDKEKREFLKKVGSNLKISDRHLSVEPRGAWKLVVDQGHFAQHNAASEISAAALFGEMSPGLQTAERAGFEPARRFKSPTAFPVLLLRPLGHLSWIFRSIRRAGNTSSWKAKARREGMKTRFSTSPLPSLSALMPSCLFPYGFVAGSVVAFPTNLS